MTLAERAKAHYPHYPAYQAAWLKMIALLGDKWLLAKRIERVQHEDQNKRSHNPPA